MNERAIIAKIKERHPVANGSLPRDVTKPQQHAFNLIGKLLKHAHKKGKRLKGRWI